MFVAIFTIWMLSTHSNSVTLKCPMYVMRALNTPPLKNVYTCHGPTIQYECDKSERLVAVSKNHIKGKGQKDLNSLWFNDHQTFKKLPVDMCKFFPKLQVLRLMYSSLETISTDDLNYPDLRAVWLGYNKLQILDGNLLMHTPKLQIATFNYNKITNIGSKLLDNVPNLSWTNFRNTDCTKGISVSQLVYDDLKDGNRKPAIDSLKKILADKCKPTETDEMIKREKQAKVKKGDDVIENTVEPTAECRKEYNFPKTVNKKSTLKYLPGTTSTLKKLPETTSTTQTQTTQTPTTQTQTTSETNVTETEIETVEIKVEVC